MDANPTDLAEIRCTIMQIRDDIARMSADIREIKNMNVEIREDIANSNIDAHRMMTSLRKYIRNCL